ncbi:MAG: tRNA dihydrouridine synthase DusB [Firmicutes bacterium]|nr:tRNA dihydrouridine synthase DusB [Bacillota bacterium]MBR3374810.1 tRNA dihydrouridine synthase DusB [Bacillota bacterium]
MVTIGKVELKDRFVLAPLAGITDGAFRRICFQMGAAMACSEMVSAKGLFYGDKKTGKLLEILPGEGPVGYQIFGHEPDIMAFAARELEKYDNAFLDINMGCPVPKIVKNHEGSYLMKDPDLCFDLVQACVKNTAKPVTVKIRAGWDTDHINAAEVAGACESAGAAAVAVHGRTREQYYSGKADWSVIAAVKRAVSRIPVIGNGDVMNRGDGIRMMEETGCDLVMIGRGALGNPWIFDKDHEGRPSPEELKAVMLRHLTDTAELKGDHIAVLEMRKHVGWYLKGRPGAAAFRDQVNRIDDLEELKNAIDGIL